MNRKAISGSFYTGNKESFQTHFILDKTAVLQNKNGRFVLESASITEKHYDSPAIFDETQNLLSIPSAWAFNTTYQASFKHLGDYVFELISASPKK